MKFGKHQRSKQRCQDLGWNYVTNTFLLVSSSVSSKQLLCFVHGQGQKSEQKPTTKNFVEFHNHSPLLTMLRWTNRVNFALPCVFVCSLLTPYFVLMI